MISQESIQQIALSLRNNRRDAPLRFRPYLDKLAHDLADLFTVESLAAFDRDRFLIAASTPRNHPQCCICGAGTPWRPGPEHAPWCADTAAYLQAEADLANNA